MANTWGNSVSLQVALGAADWLERQDHALLKASSQALRKAAHVWLTARRRARRAYGNGRGDPVIPGIALPSNFASGDRFFSMDFRLAKIVRVRERYEINVFAEVFNLLNLANLSGYGTNLLEPSSFGQPASRVTQVFGAGGPRAFQMGARFSF